MSFKLDKKKKSKLFSLSDKLESAHDFVQHKVDAHADNIIVELLLSSIKTEQQVRTSFNKEAIDQLAKSIEKEGLLYPILVMEDPKNKKEYILLVGESRLKAAHKLGWEKIPARVKPFIENNGDRKLIQLTENIQRNNLSAIDLAGSFMGIKSDLKITLEELAQRVGRSTSYVKQLSRINNLSDSEKNEFKGKGIREIIAYIDKKKSKSTTVVLSEKAEQLSLFRQTKTSLKMSAFKIDYKTENKDTISNKIKECEQFLREAKKRLKKLN
tara:strand:+ start:1298 stop:2107 length:810 start_codon:yes stop_codon:yes gene_type:complete